MCLHRRGCPSLTCDLLRLNGGSTSIAVGDRSSVGRVLITNAWPPELEIQLRAYRVTQMNQPMALAEPGSTSTVVRPPATALA